MDKEGADSKEFELTIGAGGDELREEGRVGVDELGRKRKGVGAGKGEGGSVGIRRILWCWSCDGGGRENGRGRCCGGNLRGPSIGFLEAEGCLWTAIVIMGIYMEDLLVGSGE